MNGFYRKHRNEITLVCLSSANIPIIYLWFVDNSTSLGMKLFGGLACIGLDLAVITQTQEERKSWFTWTAILLSSGFVALIGVNHYNHFIGNGYLHACYAVVMLFVALSNARSQAQDRHLVSELAIPKQEIYPVPVEVKPDVTVVTKDMSTGITNVTQVTNDIPMLNEKEQRVYRYVLDNPEVTSAKVISQALGYNYNTTKVYISRLRKQGLLSCNSGYKVDI